MEVWDTGSLGDGSPQLDPGGDPLGGLNPPKAHSILQTFGCQTMHNFVYQPKQHEPVVKHEKKPIGRCVCLQSCQVAEIQVREIRN